MLFFEFSLLWEYTHTLMCLFFFFIKDMQEQIFQKSLGTKSLVMQTGSLCYF